MNEIRPPGLAGECGPASAGDGPPRLARALGPLLRAVLVVVAALAFATSAPAAPPPAGSPRHPQVAGPAPKPAAPRTAVREVVDTLHGVEVRDPYRWLEDQDAPSTRAWIAAQNAYTDAVLHALPGRDRLRELAAAVLERGATASKATTACWSIRTP